MDMFVRIKPTNRRELHCLNAINFRKSAGWYRVSGAMAERCRKEKMNDLNPAASPCVFDVCTAEQAGAMAEAEQQVVNPAGTPAAPRVVDDPADMRAEPEAPPAPAPKPTPRLPRPAPAGHKKKHRR